MKYALLSFYLLCSLTPTFLAFAEIPKTETSPHVSTTTEVGRIVGQVLVNGKTPLPNHTAVLEVLKEHSLILAIPKQTDAKGHYEFKNIFRSPDFAYAISSEYNGKTFRTDFVSLGNNENQRTLNLAVGASAAEGPPLPSPIRDDEVMETQQHTHDHNGESLGQYKLLAALLSIGAIVYAFARRKRGQ